MSLTAEELEKIALLARLGLDAQTKTAALEKMGHVMDLVDQINSVDTTGIQPMAHPLENMVQPLREDTVTETDNRSEFQALAPAAEAGLYLVPKVIEEE
ncbi:MAG: Asp-tRNA(Asn)/Glu-tRNA(Gln) amidotransferase GatCAB subunit C [Legionellales bacterium]|nr:Asp-tRNA(Asn)/Glu-tRNA(Gln) amidotransferase GatCAB subunit C [Legionellales bacterium]|tara:strand:+ start:43 stop:339 length:297 start_codon:yes stop_codon:yes gene_type:complete